MRKSLFTGRVPVQSDITGISSLKVDIVNNTKSLDLRLIDTSNIFNIYICTITPGDFSVTKREQGIKVDFEKFIRILIQFFMDLNDGSMSAYFSCIEIESEKKDNKKDYARNRESHPGNIYKFVFVENNTFRNITRLELVFYKPDDHEFKRYLSDLITRFEEDNIKLIRENMNMKETLQSKDDEFKKVSKETKMEIREMKEKIDKLYRENCLLEDENERKNIEIENLEKKVNEGDKKMLDLDYEFEKMKISELKKQSSIKELEELKKAILKSEREIDEKNTENKNLKEELKKLKRKVYEYEEREKEYKEDIEMLQKEIDDRNTRKNNFEKKINELKQFIIEKESKIKNIEKENKDLQKNLANAHKIQKHFKNKHVDQDSVDKSHDNSLSSSFIPESPPSK